jgi:proteic killer suppression protein
MEVRFVDPALARLDTDADCPTHLGAAVVRKFRKVVRFIRAAKDERDFRAMRSLKFEKLKGDRSHQHSLRINRQWRLIVEVEKGKHKNRIAILAIEDYHS